MEHIELRSLKADDIFPMFTLLSKVGVEKFKHVFEGDDVKKAIAKGNSEDSVGIAVAIDIAGILIANIPNAKNEIYQFLENVSGLSKADISELPMATFMQMIIDVVQQEGFHDFFQVVSKLFK